MLCLIGAAVFCFVRQRNKKAGGASATLTPTAPFDSGREMTSARDWDENVEAAAPAKETRKTPVESKASAVVVVSDDEEEPRAVAKPARKSNKDKKAQSHKSSSKSSLHKSERAKSREGLSDESIASWRELLPGVDEAAEVTVDAMQSALIRFGTSKALFSGAKKDALRSVVNGLVDEMDVDDSGFVSLHEFSQALNSRSIEDWLRDATGSISSASSPVASTSGGSAGGSLASRKAVAIAESSVQQTHSNASESSLRRLGERALPDSKVIKPSELVPCDGASEPLVLGEGGFGQVTKMHWTGGPFDVAVKSLLQTKEDKSGRVRLMFEREAALQAELNHPSILTIYGVVLEGSALCIVMPLMKRSLYDAYYHRAAGEDMLAWPDRARVCAETASGLNYLHTRQPAILHRDLKSLNVMLTERDEVKLVDFGLAEVKRSIASIKSVVTKETGEGRSAVGTVQWQAPELHSLKPKYSPASDVYALAMVAWEVAHEQVPFVEAPNPVAIVEAVKAGEREEIDERVPEAFAQAIRDCWAQDAAQRPSAREAAKLFSAVAEGLKKK